MSSSFNFDKQDIVKWLHNILVMYGPVFLLFCDQIQSGHLDWKLLAGMVISVSIDFLKRYIRGVDSVTP